MRGGVVEQRVLVAADVLDADALDVVERRAQAHRIGDVAGAGLEARRRRRGRRALEGHVRRSCCRRPARAACPPAPRACRRPRRCRSGRRSCGRRRRRSRRRAPARPPRMCDTDCAPSTSVRAPARWAISTISFTGTTVPSALETCVTETILVVSLSSSLVFLQDHLARVVHRDDAELRALLAGRAAARARCWRGAPGG